MFLSDITATFFDRRDMHKNEVIFSDVVVWKYSLPRLLSHDYKPPHQPWHVSSNTRKSQQKILTPPHAIAHLSLPLRIFFIEPHFAEPSPVLLAAAQIQLGQELWRHGRDVLPGAVAVEAAEAGAEADEHVGGSREREREHERWI